jgi:hypothetical protein
MKTAIILSAAALIAAAPGALAQGTPNKTPGLHHKVSRNYHPGISGGYVPVREMQAKGAKKGHPGAFGYLPAETDRDLEMSRQAGGGGGM